MNNQNYVILVDPQNKVLGTKEKISAHEDGDLHRAFSIFLFHYDSDGNLNVLLQKRAADKYHFDGLWSNTCCSHQHLNESATDAGSRRLFEELNFSCDLTEVGTFIYRAESENGLIEHELDHVLVGFIDTELPAPNPLEVELIEWITISSLELDLAQNPSIYTPWLPLALPLALNYVFGLKKTA